MKSLEIPYHFIQYLMQIANQIEWQVDQAEFLAFRSLYKIYGVRVRPNADGYVYIRVVHEHLERTEMGVGAALHFNRIEFGVVGEQEINLCTIVGLGPKRAMLTYSVFH